MHIAIDIGRLAESLADSFSDWATAHGRKALDGPEREALVRLETAIIMLAAADERCDVANYPSSDEQRGDENAGTNLDARRTFAGRVLAADHVAPGTRLPARDAG